MQCYFYSRVPNRYWMDRYPAKDRLLISYEGLTDDFIGPEVAKGLNDFLGQVDGVDPIESDSVPCVWRAVVKNILPPQQAERIKKLQELAEKIELDKIAAETGGQAAAPTQQEGQAAAGGDDAQAQRDAYLAKTAFDLGGGRRALSTAGGGTPGLRRRLDLGHGNSQRKGPDEPRPYTVQQLDMMMSMLMEVAERYKNEDIRLYHVMMGYYEKIRVERIKLDPNGVETPPGGVY